MSIQTPQPYDQALVSFSGISDPSDYPPDNALAVGPSNVVTGEEAKVAWSDLAGNSMTTQSAYGFVPAATVNNQASWTGSLKDYRFAYDPTTGKYIFAGINFLGGLTPQQSFIVIGESNTSNPNGGWTFSSFNTNLVLSGTQTVSDELTLALSGSNIVVSADQYNANGPGFFGTATWVLPESTATSGNQDTSPVAPTFLSPVADSLARAAGGPNSSVYLLSDYVNSGVFHLVEQQYASSGTLLGSTDIQAGSIDQASSTQYSAAQQGTATLLNVQDSRIQSPVYANGYLYAVAEVEAPGSTTPDVHWFKIDASNPSAATIVAQGDVTLGAGIATFDPSIAVDSSGDVLINFSASSATMFPADYYTYLAAGSSSWSTPVQYKASTAPYVSGTSDQRWGDVSTAIADPNKANAFWISNEFIDSTLAGPAGQTGGWWSTVTAEVEVFPVPTITGTQANQATSSDAAISPFTKVVIADPNAAATETLTISLSGGGGVLTGAGPVSNTGTYAISGTPSAVTSALETVVFTPSPAQPGSSSTTTFTLSDQSSVYKTAVTDSTTSVIDTESPVAPQISGTQANQATSSDSPIAPFSNVTITDANAGATEALTISLSGGGGALSGAGLIQNPDGSYTLSGTASGVTSALKALVFTPSPGQPGSSTTTSFTLSDQSSVYKAAVTDGNTSVVDTDPASPGGVVSNPPPQGSGQGASTPIVGALDQEIARLYFALLDRTPDEAGLQTYANSGQRLTRIATDLIDSGEYGGLHGPLTNREFVQTLYEGALGRDPVGTEAHSYIRDLHDGVSRGRIAVAIAESSEAQAHLASQMHIP